MLKKKLGINAIERDWYYSGRTSTANYFKIPSPLIIPEGCRSIGCGTFQNCIELKKVVIPENVDRVGDWAFWGCSNADIIVEKSEEEFRYLGPFCFGGRKSIKYVEEKIRS